MACYPDYYTLEDARRDYAGPDSAWTTWEGEDNHIVTYRPLPEHALQSFAHDLIKRGDDDFRASNSNFIKYCLTVMDCDTRRDR